MKNIILVLTLLVAQNSMGQQQKSNYSLNCWDRTFAYNSLEIEEIGPDLQFNISGLSIGSNKLFFEQNITTNANVKFSISKKDCYFDEQNKLLLNCSSEDLEVSSFKDTSELEPIKKSIGPIFLGVHILKAAAGNESYVFLMESNGWDSKVLHYQNYGYLDSCSI